MKIIRKKTAVLPLLAAMLLVSAACSPQAVQNSASQAQSSTAQSSNSQTAASGSSAGQTADITVLYTNDVHCAVDTAIGYAGVAAYRDELEAAGQQVLLVDAGDAVQGTSIGSLSLGKAPVEIMNQLGYCAMAVGNHEFDYGIDQLKVLAELADFPFLSLNFQTAADGKDVFRPYTIVECAGVKIAFLGVSTPETLTNARPTYFMDGSGNFLYTFLGDSEGTALWQAVQQNVDAARSEGADYVIALSHLGVNSASSPYMSTEMIAATSGIDCVLDGHSHTVIESESVTDKAGKKVLLSSTGTGLVNLGCLKITKDGKLSAALVSGYEPKEEAAAAFIAQLQAENETLLAKEIGTTANALVIKDPGTGARLIRNAETNLGDLVADAFREAAGADIALMKGGGIRVDLPAGTVTYKDVLAVLPFSDHVCLVSVTGQQILDALELSVSRVPDENGGFLQVSGLTFTYRTDIPSPVVLDASEMFAGISGERRVQSVLIGGRPLDAAAAYTLAGADFLVRDAGNGFSMLSQGTMLRSDFGLDFDVLCDYLTGTYLKDTAKYAPVYGEGRIAAAE